MLSSFYPIVSGRVSDALARNRSLYQAQTGKMDLQRLQDQISSGLAFTKPSDNPIAALKIVSIQRQVEFQNQQLVNLESANSYLAITDGNLGSIAEVMNDVRGIALEASTTTATDAERESWLTQINTALSRLETLANANYMDRYLFAGGQSGQTAVGQSSKPNSNGMVFYGNDLSLNTIGGNQDYVPQNVLGQSALGLISNSVSSQTNLAPALHPTTKISQWNLGQGVDLGSLQFSDGNEKVIVDLSDVEFTQDILDKVNGQVSLSGRPIEITLQDDRFHVNYADGLPGTIRITDPANSRTAANLGIETNGPLPVLPIHGQPIEIVASPATLLTDLNQGNGFDWADGLRIRQGSQVYDVSFDGAETLEDVFQAIESSGAYVRSSLSSDGQSIQIKSTLSGVDFSISESNGELASQLGLRTLHEGTRLSELNHGQGIQMAVGPDLSITKSDGSEIQVDLDGSFALQDVLDAINNHPDNQDPLTRVEATLSSTGEGIRLSSPVSASGSSSTPITIKTINGSSAAIGLGLVSKGQTESIGQAEGTSYVIQGTDPNPQEINGVFNSLLKLRDAISSQNLEEISRVTELIDSDLSKIHLARGSIGIQQARIQSLQYATEDAQLQLEANRADLQEVDMIAAISELKDRQVAYEASLQFLASSSQLSLFNYL